MNRLDDPEDIPDEELRQKGRHDEWHRLLKQMNREKRKDQRG